MVEIFMVLAHTWLGLAWLGAKIGQGETARFCVTKNPKETYSDAIVMRAEYVSLCLWITC